MSQSDDSRFYATFKALMQGFGLPCPETLFGTLSSALATTGAMIEALKVSPSSSAVEVLRAFPARGGQVAKLAGLSELLKTLGGYLAAAYVGACIGAVIVSAWDTWGVAAVGKLRVLFRDCEQTHGKALHQLLQEITTANPMRSGNMTMMLAIDKARFMSPLPSGRGASGSW
jgi:hypothetical protein